MITRLTAAVAAMVPFFGSTACSLAVGPEAESGAGTFAEALDRTGAPGIVLTETNAAEGNELVTFTRAADGSLTAAGVFETGGSGSGDALGSQGAIVRSGDWVLAVNAGSNDVSTFAMGTRGLSFAARSASGGTRPVSIAAHDRIVYVLNAGATPNISGFWIGDDGALKPIAHSAQPLSGGAVGPAEIAFSPDGDTLVVTEKATSRIDTYFVDRSGRAHAPVVHASNGATPFGFDFTPAGELVVSEASTSSASAYRVAREVRLESVAGSVPNGQKAACWLVVDRRGEYAFTANAGSGNISAYRIGPSGTLRLEGSGVAGVTGSGSHPVDMAFGADGRYLYVLETGTGQVGAFDVRHAQLDARGAAGTLPSTAAGLVAW
jgi:6-phosphogluconolactonase (cycloisomerase 2 family)